MKKALFILAILFSATVFSQGNSSSEKYLANTLMLKVKSEFRSFCSADGISQPGIKEVLTQIKSNSCKKEFPRHTAPLRPFNAAGIKMSDLSLIYKVTYDGTETPKVLAQKLLSTGFFEYVEPFFLHDVLYTPNDGENGSQYYLSTVKAYQAWDHAQGDPNIVIGMTDTGVEYTHPELVNSIKYNTNDPIDNIDNDLDGYIDNYKGWDTGSNDNDASVGSDPHGVMTSGVAAASTDNANQISGVGFKSKFLPIRISNSSNQLTGTYSAIVYAADHGCKIINCSWGSANSWSQLGQDIITYAAINMNCLVVCSAGNNDNTGVFYPASYEWALSVGGTDSSNKKYAIPGNGSNYNEYVDICAPGRTIYTITTGGASISGRIGTSFAAPIVSGAAAVAWSKYPTYSGLQIGELLKATADSLEFYPSNAPYIGKLGEGLLNMEKSVTLTGLPGLYLSSIGISGNNNGKMVSGDTLTATGKLINFLSASSAGTTVKISTTNAFISFVNPTITVGAIANLDTLDLSANPFKMVVLPGMPVNNTVDFIFTITDGSYNTKYFSSVILNLDYVDININKIGTSVGASGKVGYNTLGVQSNGLGVTYNGSSSLLYQYGLMIADNTNQVSYVLDGDFTTEKSLVVKNPGIISDFDVHSQYTDTSIATKLDISVKQKTLAWSDVKKENFVLMEHTIINNSVNTYSNIHVGMYADWDINNVTDNVATFDATNNIAYTYDPSSTFGGIHLINDDPVHHYAFNNDGSNGSFGIYDLYTQAEQFTTLTSGNSRNTSTPSDASQIIGAGPYTIAPGDSIVVVYAVVAGKSLLEIQNASLESDSIYDRLTGFDLVVGSSTNPTCFADCNGSITVSATNGYAPYSYLWNDASSQTGSIATNLCAGTYTCTVTDLIGNVEVISSTITNPTKTTVSLGSDTTLCTGGSKTINAGLGSTTYLWSNGATTPSITVSTANSYSVIVTNAIGCKAKDTLEVYANTSPSVDLGSDQSICSSSPLTLDAANTGLNFLWSTGATSQTISVSSSANYWVKVTNLGGCSDFDTVTVTITTLPVVDLGADQGGCAGFQAVLNAGNPGKSFLWSTGSTGQTITASISGDYWVKVTSGIGCLDMDTVTINIENPPIVNLGKDTSICKSSSMILNAGNPNYTYLWNDASTEQTLNVTKAGTYFVKVGNYCFASDTIVLNSLSSPLVSYKSSFITAYNTNKGDVTLNFGLPVGGTYSGTGVSNGIFNTKTAGDGIHKITYSVTGANGCVGSVWLNLDVNLQNSVQEFTTNELMVSPNPFSESIQVSFSNETLVQENINYLLFDAQGKIVEQGTIVAQSEVVNYTINTQNFVSGLYHLVLQNNQFKSNYKLVKH